MPQIDVLGVIQSVRAAGTGGGDGCLGSVLSASPGLWG